MEVDLALLADAGMADGFTIPMVNSQITQLANLGQLVQAQLSAIGVTVEIVFHFPFSSGGRCCQIRSSSFHLSRSRAVAVPSVIQSRT